MFEKTPPDNLKNEKLRELYLKSFVTKEHQPISGFDDYYEYQEFDVATFAKLTQIETIEVCMLFFKQHLNWIPKDKLNDPNQFEGMAQTIRKYFGIEE